METTHSFKIMDRSTLEKKLNQEEKFHLWNVLTDEYYQAGNSIPCSTRVPVDRLEQIVPELGIGKDEEIVVYCAGSNCTASKLAAEKLAQAGYTNVSAYEGGIKDWHEGKKGAAQGGCSSCG